MPCTEGSKCTQYPRNALFVIVPAMEEQIPGSDARQPERGSVHPRPQHSPCARRAAGQHPAGDLGGARLGGGEGGQCDFSAKFGRMCNVQGTSLRAARSQQVPQRGLGQRGWHETRCCV
jgi:hypothetical protein